MLRRSFLPTLFILLLASCASAPPAGQTQTSSARRVLVISLDGMRPEHYLRSRELGISTPHLKSLMDRGVWAEGVDGVYPTMTYPSHGTLMTGVKPAQHGIISNRYFDPTNDPDDPWYWYADDFRVPTLIGAAAEKGLSTAAIAWPSTINIGATFNVPDFWRPAANHPSDRNLLEAVSSPPDILDAAGTFRGRVIGERNHWTDQERVDLARYVIEKHRPSLTMVHLLGTDAAQHEHGPDSPRTVEAVAAADRYVGQLLDSLRQAGVREKTVVLVVSDHGFLPATRSILPNTLLRERGLITLNDAGAVTSWKAMFHADGGSATLHLRDESDMETLETVRRLMTQKKAEDGSGIRRILAREEIARMGGSAPLALEVEDGLRVSDRLTGGWFESLHANGAHGHPPDRVEMRGSLIISNVRERGSLGVVPMTRVAPTVAKILDIALSPGAGPPLDATPLH